MRDYSCRKYGIKKCITCGSEFVCVGPRHFFCWLCKKQNIKDENKRYRLIRWQKLKTNCNCRGVEIENNGKKYCSNYCRKKIAIYKRAQKNISLKILKCEFCGITFVKKAHNQITCSQKCLKKLDHIVEASRKYSISKRENLTNTYLVDLLKKEGLPINNNMLLLLRLRISTKRKIKSLKKQKEDLNGSAYAHA